MESGLKSTSPIIGQRCLATLGPDDQPNERVIVIVRGQSSFLGAFLCEDVAGKRMLTVREGKLKPV